MTIENQQRRIVYDADGVSLAYPVPFPFLEPEWLTVSVGTGEIGTTDTTLVDGVDYEVTGAGDPAGGVVILATPQPDGMKLAISRWVPLTQQEVYPEGGKFPAETTEDCFDKLTMIAQQLKDLATSNNFSPSTSTETGAHVAAWISEQVQAAGEAAEAAEQSATEAAASAESVRQSEANAAQSAANARADADRAEALVAPAALASSVFNVRKAQVLAAGASGQIVTLVGYYYPTRDVLYLSYNGAVLTPNKPGVQPTGDYSYEEVGADPNVVSNQVKLHFATRAGDVLDMFVVSSAAGRNIEEIEALVAQAAASATAAAASVTDAAGEAARAEDEADRAEQAALTLPPLSTAAEGDVIQARLVGGTMQNVYAQPASPATKRQDTVLVSSMANGVSFSVPAYIVGSNKLTIYLDGVLCDSGASGLYLEQGTIGNTSTTIKTNDVLLAGRELTAIVAG